MEALERLIFLDTETTGLDPRLGHRIIEVAAVEAIGRDLTGKWLHFYVDPEREIDAGATAVHGYSWDDLRGKPKFSAVAEELLSFLAGARVVIHNAPFDVSFLDQELARLRLPPMSRRDIRITDSLALAKEKYPGKRNSLDALCDRLGVDNSHRNLHGALLDAKLLAEVYFGLTRGQGVLDMPVAASVAVVNFDGSFAAAAGESLPIADVPLPSALAVAHEQYMAKLAQQSGVERAWHTAAPL
jgi:DNA polymerase-3 subunit epsilon